MTASLDYQQTSRATLENALRNVAGYASWRSLDPGPGVPVDQRYAALPVLSKQQLRDGFPAAFVPRTKDLERGLARGEVEFAKTSGSTDDEVTLVFHVPWWEASERAAWQLSAHARRVATGTHREAVLASPRCVGPGYAEQPLAPPKRTLGRHLYLNQTIDPAAWTGDDVARMAEELRRYQPAVLEADAAYLAPLARRVAERGLAIAQPELIFLTYSYPSRVYLRQIRRAFSAPIASSYGSTETGHVFMECEAGRLHQNVAHCRVDFEPWLPRYGGPARGRMLVSVFHNPWFAVLRFDIGDVARLARGPCPCGRSAGLTLDAIEGRIVDVTFAPDGSTVTVDDLDRALVEIDALRGWQLDLPAPGSMRLRILAEPGATANACRQAREILAALYGAAGTKEVVVEDLQPEASGKFRFARAAFPVDHSILWKGAP